MLDTENRVPLYYQLVQTLEQQIETEMQANEKLPSEKDICEMYSVSRTTARLALAELEKMGYIYRIQGKGSFVSTLTPQSANTFFTIGEIENEFLILSKKKLQSQLKFYQKETAAADICKAMGLTSDQAVVHVQYLHKLGRKNAVIEDFYFRNRLFHSLITNLQETENLVTILSKMDFSIKTVEEFYQLVTDEESTAQYLQIEKKFFDTTNESIILNRKKILSNEISYRNFAQNS